MSGIIIENTPINSAQREKDERRTVSSIENSNQPVFYCENILSHHTVFENRDR